MKSPGSGLRQDLILLRDRRFGQMFGARFTSVMGNAVSPVAIAFGILDIPDASAVTLSMVLAAQSIATVALMLYGGVIADRRSRFRVIATADALSAVACLGLALMLAKGWAPPMMLIGCAVLIGAATALLIPALTGVVTDLVGADQLQAANGLLHLATNIARACGFLLSGSAVAFVGPGWTLGFGASCFLVSAVVVGLIRSERSSPPASGGLTAALRDGWREFRSRRWLWTVVVQSAFVMAAFTAVLGVLGPVTAKRQLGGPLAWSAILTAWTVGMAVGVLVAMRLRPRRPVFVAVLFIFVVILPFVMLGLPLPLGVVVVTAFFAGIAMDIQAVLWQTTLQRELPPDMLSRVSAYDMFGSYLVGPLGILAAGPLAVSMGPRFALLAYAAVAATATAVVLFVPEVRRLQAPDAARGQRYEERLTVVTPD